MVSSNARSSFYMVEKDLPPTPSDESSSSAGQRAGYSPAHGSQDNIQSLAPEPFNSTRAHASLEVGVSHVLVHTSPPLSPNEINTVAFASSTPSSPANSSQPRPRKNKSAQRLEANLAPHPVEMGNPDVDMERTRSRVISFSGPTLDVTTKSDVRNERKSVDRPSTPKGLARRASFWSRKKLQPEDTSTILSSVQRPRTPQSSQLPALHSVSPVDMSITITPSIPSPDAELTKPKSGHSRGLSRSHSARSPLRPPLEMENTSTLQKHLPTSTPTLSPSRAYVSPSTEVVLEGKDALSAPKPRPRAQTNPPLLNRLSLGWLPTSPAIPMLPRSSNHSPVSPRPHTSSSFIGSSMGRRNPFSPSTGFDSSRSSQISFEKGTPVTVPLPTGDEGPIDYLRRLQAAVSKAEVAGVLASSSDPFYCQALRTYIGEFNFMNDPLDVAVRKLLMDVGLPRETQQIDRVIEAFANRYLQCNPTLFTSDDHPYILAFSLIMLHTDAFNKSNKRKMSKADYIKNTRLPGLFSEVLDCFYDNIVFAPFIFIEDPLDFNGQRDITHKESNQSINLNSTVVTSPVTPIIRTTKVDPYYLITNDLLRPVRLDVDSLIPMDNPYSYEGTAGPWDEGQLQHSFVTAHQIEVSISDTSRASPFFSKGTAGRSVATSPGKGGGSSPLTATASTGETRTLKLSKVGSLSRKDDILEGGRKAGNRKWKSWTVILTGSQLLFFRDASWATSLPSLTPGGHNILSQSALLRPDELLSVRGAIAVYDKSYNKYSNTFRFLLPDGRQLLLQAPSENELNEWIAGINYASAFKTAGVRIRPLEMSSVDVKLTGVAAATSHLHDLQTLSNKGRVSTDHAMPSGAQQEVEQHSLGKRKLTIITNSPYDVDLEVPTAPEVDGAEQLKATFDQVKADLAAGMVTTSTKGTCISSLDPTSFDSSPSTLAKTSPLPSRTSIIQSKIDALEVRITAVQTQLDTYMRFVRNISILTPFQKSTRERLVAAIQNVAQRIMLARLEVTRLACHRDILANDIASEGRSWHRAKTIALQAAAETLQNRRETVPRMTLSQPACDPVDIHLGPQNSFSSHALSSSPSRMSDSSICDSFYSALDFGPDWPASEDASLNFLGTSHLFDSPSPSTTPSVHSQSIYDNAEASRQNSDLLELDSPRTSGDFFSREKLYTAPEGLQEEAQDWNQTRCAQRVSLVRVPSSLQLKSRSVQNSQPEA
ncbi:hypothetical protein H0H92_001531 [Tricholoma furcatifolium]|nr:hypothetical protein H0H92_001531 [Tricholoma furcatifolium]